MKWEIEWVLDNVDQYQSVEHANAVVQNIKKRYMIVELKSLIKEYEIRYGML